MSKALKILLLGDASNHNVALASGLRDLGHTVTLASDGSRWMDTERDIDLSRRRGKTGGALLYLRLRTALRRDLAHYDIVQLSSPGFVRLRPKRLETIARQLRRDNGALYLTALGTDSAFVRNLLSDKPALRYSEWHDHAGPTAWSRTASAERDAWLARELADYTDVLYAKVDGVVAALYEYYKVVEAEYPGVPLHYGGIPIVIGTMPVARHDFSQPLQILYAAHRGREGEKGADVLLKMLNRLSAELPGRCRIIKPENMPYRDFIQLLAKSHMVSDQLHSFTPGTTALLAMAAGAVPISGGEPEYYDFIQEHELRPIFNPDPGDTKGTYTRLKELVSSPDALARMSAQGRSFVIRHNSATVVARRYELAWGLK